MYAFKKTDPARVAMPDGYVGLHLGLHLDEPERQAIIDEILALTETPSRRELRALPRGESIDYLTMHPRGICALKRRYVKRKHGVVETEMELVSVAAAHAGLAAAARAGGAALRPLSGPDSARWVGLNGPSKYEGPVNR